MVDYAELRRKFPPKKPSGAAHRAKIEAVRREFARKRAEMGGVNAPTFKKGFVFYTVVVIGLLMLGSLVLSATGRGGRAPISKALLQAHKSVDALAVALGRYRYHVGTYPTTAEGLAFLASDKVRKRGWNGPYIRRVVKDPWGQDYVYAWDGASETPVLYSKGPDRGAGTADDILPAAGLFEEPFRDTGWTREWMPYRYRGYVLAPDKETKAALEKQVGELRRAAAAADDARHRLVRPDDATLIQRACRQREALRAQEQARAVRLLTDWTHPGREGQRVTVVCETRGDGALLYVDNEPLGAANVTNLPRLAWNVPYRPGELKVIAYAEGSPIGEASVRTAQKAAALTFAADRPALADGACELVDVLLVDEAGVRRPDSGAEVALSLEGPGEIVASGDYTLDGAGLVPGRRTVRLKDGRATFLVWRKPGSGHPLELRAQSAGLRPARQTLPWEAAD